MKKFLFIAILLTFCLSMASADYKEISKAAEEGLQKFLGLIPEEMLQDYGFENSSQKASCKLEQPMQLYVIPPKSLEAYNANSTVESMVENTGVWYFPVVCEGNHKAIVVVAKMDQKWQAVSFGYIPLAKELQNMSRSWSRKRGHNPMLIVMYQAREYLFHVPELNAQNLTAIEFNPSRSVDYLRTSSTNDVVPELLKKAQENIKAQQQFDNK